MHSGTLFSLFVLVCVCVQCIRYAVVVFLALCAVRGLDYAKHKHTIVDL